MLFAPILLKRSFLKISVTSPVHNRVNAQNYLDLTNLLIADLCFRFNEIKRQERYINCLSYSFTSGSSTQYVHIMGEGRDQAKCARLHTRIEGGFKVAQYAKKIFFGPQNLKTFFFVQKKLLHCHLLLRIEKCKLALS